MFLFKPRLVLALGAIAPAGPTAVPATLAAPRAKSSHQVFYVCNDCHLFYTAAAKRAGYKDSMGDKLIKVSKVPAGYADGSKMKM